MLNFKNNENDAVFDEIYKNREEKIRFQKIKDTLLDSIPRLKSYQPPLVGISQNLDLNISEYFKWIFTVNRNASINPVSKLGL